ncbi:MAG: zinc ribbon domain-containing protein [Haloarculaceae archaeon]
MSPAESSGILGAGAYAPALRIAAAEFEDAWGRFSPPGIEQKAVPEADEDALTMAWEAGRRALAAADATADDVTWLGFATTTPPLEESDLTARLGSFFGVPEDAGRQEFTGSTRAGTRALFAALDADLGDGVGLVIASDAPHGSPEDEREHAAGAGAAALVVGPDAPGEIVDRAEYATPYPGTRFRRLGSEDVEGLDVTSYDRQAFSEALGGAVSTLDADVGEVDAAAVQAPNGGLPYRSAGALGVDAETIGTCATVQDLGDTAAASVLLSLATALADGDERILAASFGSGAGADALLIEAGDVPAVADLEGGTDLSYAEYLRRRGEITGDGPDGGAAYVSVPTWRRSLPQRHRLEAGRCPDCGAVVFPPEGACTECHSLVEYEPVALPSSGEVAAVTSISLGGEPPEFAAQQEKSGEYGVAIVAFDADGDAVDLPMQVVGTDPDPAVGDDVTTAIRRIYEQEGVIRYGRKAVAEE